MSEKAISKTDIRRVRPLSERARNLLKNFNSSNPSNFLNKFKDKIDTLSPFLQKKIENLGTNKHNRTCEFKETSLYDKYSSFWKKPKNSASDVKLFLYIFEKMKARRLRDSLRILDKRSNDLPFAATICPRCNYVGLTLLTTSTKEKLSPRFLDKIKMILPSKTNAVYTTVQPTQEEKELSLSYAPTEYRYSKSSISHDIDSPVKVNLNKTPTYHKKNISELPDLSEIQKNFSEKHSMYSDDLSDYENSHAYNSQKYKDDISFECFDQFLYSETNSKINDTNIGKNKTVIPKLNISAIKKPPRYKNIITNIDPKGSIEVLTGSPVYHEASKGLEKLSILMKKHLKPLYSRIFIKNERILDQSLSFEFSREEFQSSRINLDSILEGTFDFEGPALHAKIEENSISTRKKLPEPSLNQKTAFRIFHSKVGKLIFRRKMSAFFKLAELKK
ncbi:unnamed protein product [Blepharisma stoltei]|uniref:Uncharacterized protein n=1 Tax=Blepharisma stoltei TaxID=1481888 RepID=A0AAU9IUX0_9CILI|nr:unnamed protein product [Blepharisma stoltei]